MRTVHILSSLVAAGLILSGCDNSNNIAGINTATGTAPTAENVNVAGTNEPVVETQSYKISVKNLTLAQPMSPLLVAYHSKEVRLYTIGQPASLGLEMLAESGDNASLLATLSEKTEVTASQGGSGVFGPGKMTELTLNGTVSDCISVVSMLVNTNDAFIAASCVDVSSLAKGASMTLQLPVYDAGTEKNDEEASSIPGPAGGGEGFNEARDDRDFVASHGGVVTADDGFITSALTQTHKWSNPAALLTIERTN